MFRIKNKLFLLGILLIVVLLAGCSAKNMCFKPMKQIGDECCVDLDDNDVCDTDEAEPEIKPTVKIENVIEEKPIVQAEPTTKIEEKKVEETPGITAQVVAPEPIEEEPVIKVESPSSESYQFIELYEKKQLGYQYIYNTYWHRVKGNKIRMDLDIPKKYHGVEIDGKAYPMFHIDRIYLNRDKQTATGYCEKATICFSEDIIDVPLVLEYSDFKDTTPDELIYEYGPQKPDLFEERKYYIKGKLTTRAIYKTETGEKRVYFDPLSGLVLRVEIQIGEYPMQITEYIEISAGSVRDIDVIHRNKDEIPPEEVFYSTRS